MTIKTVKEYWEGRCLINYLMEAICSDPKNGANFALCKVQFNIWNFGCREILAETFKTEFVGETNGPNSKEGHLCQEMVKFPPIAVKNSYF